MTSQIDALEAVLSSIPEELYHEMDLEVRNAEGAATNKQRLEVLKEQQELINEENEQSETVENKAAASPKDHEDIDEKPAKEAQEAKEAKAEEEGKEAEASAGDAAGGSAERAEQDERAMKMDDPTSKGEKPAEAAKKE
jgi:LETM1 and EF-hand domain-containing protein 1